MQEAFTKFSALLEQRFRAEIPTTEDSVRYTLFAALLSSGFSAHDVVLEYPHPAINRAQIDTWIPNYKGSPIAIEFKYDRDPPGGKSQPKTQKAGAVFRDIHRLLLAGEATKADCYFVYLTTREMAVYFSNPQNRHHDYFGLQPNSSLSIKTDYFFGRPMTFMTSLGGEFEAKLTCVVACPVSSEHSLRVYRIEAIQ